MEYKYLAIVLMLKLYVYGIGTLKNQTSEADERIKWSTLA